MQYFKSLLAGFAILFCAMSVSAQTQGSKKGTTTISKFKPPVLITSLGKYKTSGAIPLIEVDDLVALPLRITDEKNNVYQVSSYQFMYKKVGVTEDEVTGKVSPTTSISANLFKVTPLPHIWIQKIGEEKKRGEELFFFDVIARDKNGRVMYAPDLKLTVE